jgi:SAM-dependent methyltransferase
MAAGLLPKPDHPFGEQSGARWVALQAGTDQMLDPLGRDVLARLGPRAGERALDVGCGCGQTTLELAELVGTTGRVLGVDISEQMLERARERTVESGHRTIELVLADAAIHRFEPAAFDLVFSRFGVMFFEDAGAAFANLQRALRPGGRLGFVCWQTIEQNPWASVPLYALRRLWPDAQVPPALVPGRPGPFAFSDPAYVRQALDRATFTAITIEPLRVPIHLGGSATLDEVVEYCCQIGPAGRQLSIVDPSLYSTGRAAIRSVLEPFASEEGVWLDGAAWIVTAEKSEA